MLKYGQVHIRDNQSYDILKLKISNIQRSSSIKPKMEMIVFQKSE